MCKRDGFFFFTPNDAFLLRTFPVVGAPAALGFSAGR